jgi:hypothetical protein
MKFTKHLYLIINAIRVIAAAICLLIILRWDTFNEPVINRNWPLIVASAVAFMHWLSLPMLFNYIGVTAIEFSEIKAKCGKGYNLPEVLISGGYVF